MVDVILECEYQLICIKSEIVQHVEGNRISELNIYNLSLIMAGAVQCHRGTIFKSP